MDRVHATDPDTPHPECEILVQSQCDDGVLLDLEGLGLEDSVIPPSKLSKLEKIGSGGFKEYVAHFTLSMGFNPCPCSVFVGRLSGKKVAIAEFRGQLTESTSFLTMDVIMLMFCFRSVDIKELKLLSRFDHPNVVRFVSQLSYCA
jgi:hypothetical protein